MRSRYQSATPPRSKLSAGIWAIALPAVLLLLTTPGVSAAQDDEPIDRGKISQGKSLFRAWCRTCHGVEAKGDGPMAEHLKVEPSDLTLLAQKEGGHFYFGRVTAKIDGREKVKGHGSKDMPVWGDAFHLLDEEGGEEVVRRKVNALVHFLRSIQGPAEKSD